ncbi:MAG: iron transporter, partial [Synergistaceae bacterium]|nr:iron transporter [Synergistaceae bacterium]
MKAVKAAMRFGGVLVLAAVIAVMGFTVAGEAAAPAPGEATQGFEEFPIGDDQVVGPLNIAGVYFQPVDMEPAGLGGLPASQSD